MKGIIFGASLFFYLKYNNHQEINKDPLILLNKLLAPYVHMTSWDNLCEHCIVSLCVCSTLGIFFSHIYVKHNTCYRYCCFPTHYLVHFDFLFLFNFQITCEHCVCIFCCQGYVINVLQCEQRLRDAGSSQLLAGFVQCTHTIFLWPIRHTTLQNQSLCIRNQSRRVSSHESHSL